MLQRITDFGNEDSLTEVTCLDAPSTPNLIDTRLLRLPCRPAANQSWSVVSISSIWISVGSPISVVVFVRVQVVAEEIVAEENLSLVAADGYRVVADDVQVLLLNIFNLIFNLLKPSRLKKASESKVCVNSVSSRSV